MFQFFVAQSKTVHIFLLSNKSEIGTFKSWVFFKKILVIIVIYYITRLLLGKVLCVEGTLRVTFVFNSCLLLNTGDPALDKGIHLSSVSHFAHVPLADQGGLWAISTASLRMGTGWQPLGMSGTTASNASAAALMHPCAHSSILCRQRTKWQALLDLAISCYIGVKSRSWPVALILWCGYLLFKVITTWVRAECKFHTLY